MKTCNYCGISKSVLSFHKRRLSNDGLASRCKDCLKVIRRTEYQKNPNKYKYRMLEKKYGVDQEFHEFLIENQGGVCAICGGLSTDGKDLHVDHCHETGIVRGLLCNQCNFGLGQFKDSPDLLLEAADYVNVQIEVSE